MLLSKSLLPVDKTTVFNKTNVIALPQYKKKLFQIKHKRFTWQNFYIQAA